MTSGMTKIDGNKHELMVRESRHKDNLPAFLFFYGIAGKVRKNQDIHMGNYVDNVDK